MSLVLATGAGIFGLWYLSRNEQLQERPPVDPYQQGDNAACRYMTTGTYGDTKDVFLLLNQQGFVESEKPDVDLAGVPFRWLKMKNGGVYKTYDLKTKYC